MFYVRLTSVKEDFAPTIHMFGINQVDKEGVPRFFEIFLAELFATFVFVCVCLAMGDQHSTEKPINAVAVGAALYYACTVSGDISGGSLNPAIGLVLNVFHKIYKLEAAKKHFGKLMCVHIFGPFTGGLLAIPFGKALLFGRKKMEGNDDKVRIFNQSEVMNNS
jgi:glycerol uptake facilitator-like aquaporin